MSCKTTKKSVPTESVDYLYSMKRGSCFGKCPVFDIKIRKDGTAVLNAKMFNKINGLLEKKLSKEEMAVLERSFDKANLFSFKDEYETSAQDLPLTVLSQSKEGMVKSVKANENMPESFINTVNLIEAIVRSEGWTVKQVYNNADSDRPAKPEIVKQEEFIFDEIIIEPKSGVRLNAWFKDMEKYGIRLIRKIDSDRNLWLITYDRENNEPNVILNMIKADPNITMAEFNKNTSPRN